MFFLSTYFVVVFLNFFLERGLRVGVKLRLLKLINRGGVLIRCWGGREGEKIEKLMSVPPLLLSTTEEINCFI